MTQKPNTVIIVTNGTAREIPADEPVFLIRGQDKVGAATVRAWCDLAAAAGADFNTVSSARWHAAKMESWPVKKVPTSPAGGVPIPERKGTPEQIAAEDRAAEQQEAREAAESVPEFEAAIRKALGGLFEDESSDLVERVRMTARAKEAADELAENRRCELFRESTTVVKQRDRITELAAQLEKAQQIHFDTVQQLKAECSAHAATKGALEAHRQLVQSEEKQHGETIDQCERAEAALLEAVNIFDPDFEWSNLKGFSEAVQIIRGSAHTLDVRIEQLTADRDQWRTDESKAVKRMQEAEKRTGELEAARIAYASEFDGDVGDIHQNIRKLKAYKDQLEEVVYLVRVALTGDANNHDDIVVVAKKARRLGVHLSHCNFGENAGHCKYGDEDCPACSQDWAWFGDALECGETYKQEIKSLKCYLEKTRVIADATLSLVTDCRTQLKLTTGQNLSEAIQCLIARATSDAKELSAINTVLGGPDGNLVEACQALVKERDGALAQMDTLPGKLEKALEDLQAEKLCAAHAGQLAVKNGKEADRLQSCLTAAETLISTLQSDLKVYRAAAGPVHVLDAKDAEIRNLREQRDRLKAEAARTPSEATAQIQQMLQKESMLENDNAQLRSSLAKVKAGLAETEALYQNARNRLMEFNAGTKPEDVARLRKDYAAAESALLVEREKYQKAELLLAGAIFGGYLDKATPGDLRKAAMQFADSLRSRIALEESNKEDRE